MNKTRRVSFYMADKHWTDLKIMCVLTHKSMSDLMRIAIQDKIRQLKDNESKKS